jgi:hypothetical protein
MSLARETAQDTESASVVSRVLKILTAFLVEIKKPQQPAYYSNTAGNPRTDEQRITVYWKKETVNAAHSNRSIVYTFKRGTVTAGSLRSRIAKDLHHPPNQVDY